MFLGARRTFVEAYFLPACVTFDPWIQATSTGFKITADGLCAHLDTWATIKRAKSEYSVRSTVKIQMNRRKSCYINNFNV
jgi:hypothetical protein